MSMTATYSPEDNKLRLYSVGRLDGETYKRVRAAGFIWAPKQSLFVAPMWTPQREDLLIELCGEIGDEDTSLVERAEERSERFEDYSESRRHDAEQAHKAVHAIADNIPLGQPILVGHHSERHARKDAERIQNGMRKAVKAWETSQYWQQRAAGAIRNAKYKERPDVRERRIKGLKSDIRVMRSKYTPDPKTRPQVWEGQEHVWCSPGGRGGSWVKRSDLPGLEAHYSRWIAHNERRLEYERAMLAEGGGAAAERFNVEVGGRVLVRGEWLCVLKVNKDREGRVTSVSTNGRYVPVRGIEEVRDYRAPSEEEAAKVKEAIKKAPLCNYPGERFATITQEKWDALHKDYRGSREIEATATVARHRVRVAQGFRCVLPPPEGKELEPGYCSANRSHTYWPVFVTDAKIVYPPGAPLVPPPQKPTIERQYEAPKLETCKDDEDPTCKKCSEPFSKHELSGPDIICPRDKFDALKATLSAGVKVVTAPQLFPTPPEVARRMVELAEVQAGECVLEPSAGTGNIVRAVLDHVDTEVLAYEINYDLCAMLTRTFPSYKLQARCHDFLEVTDFQGQYPVVLMNPPFENGADIKHILHAVTFLKPGGRLVAICANGPRQQEKLRPLADTWEELPPDTFKEQGTSVRTVLLTMSKAQEPGPYHVPVNVIGEVGRILDESTYSGAPNEDAEAFRLR